MKTILIKTKSQKLSKADSKLVANTIRRGGIVVFPTETVYGIGADAFNAEACSKIFRIKGRKSDNPLIVHVSGMPMAKKIGYINKKQEKVLKQIWPGPLTVIVRSRKHVPKVVTAGLDTVALRMPDNETALEMIRTANTPIAAPSANPSTKPSATNAKHAIDYFDGKVDLIIDGGAAKHGIESTTLALDSMTIMRPGTFTKEDIEKAFGVKAKYAKSNEKNISPGMKYKHYSPSTPIFIFKGDSNKLSKILKGIEGKACVIGSSEFCVNLENDSIESIKLGSTKKREELGRNLYASLIQLDKTSPDFGVIEEFREKGIGVALMNRIKKSCNYKYFSEQVELQRLLDTNT